MGLRPPLLRICKTDDGEDLFTKRQCVRIWCGVICENIKICAAASVLIIAVLPQTQPYGFNPYFMLPTTAL